MSYYDENGNLIGEEGQIPVLPEPSERKVKLSIKDGTTDDLAKVDADGSLNVKVTDMPPVTVNAEGIVVNVSNQVEVTNSEGDPIPVSGTVDVGNFPDFPTNQSVTVTNEVLTVDVNNLAFPEVQEVSGSVNATIVGDVTVGNFPNFPETQAVSIADTVEVSFAEGQVVTISNPTTDVSVSGSVEVTNTNLNVTVSNPTTDVNATITNENLNVTVSNPQTEITVLNEGFNATITNTNLDVTVSNPVDSVTVLNENLNVTVSNPTTDVSVSGTVEVTNENLNVTVSNPTESVTVLNENLDVTFSNTSIEVSSLPNITIQNTSFDSNITNENLDVTVSNMIESDSIGQAVNQYFEQRYTLYSDNATMYADAMPPSLDPYGRDGFHYLNNYANGATTGQKKINWYFYDPTRVTSTYAQLSNAWALVTMDKATNHPFFFVYGTTNGTTISSAWVFSAKTVTLQAGKTYLFYFGTEVPTVFQDVPRVQLDYNDSVSYGTRNPNEFVYSIAITTNSGDTSSATEFQTYALGFKANGNDQSLKLAMKNANPTVVTGTVNVGNLSFPETQNVNVTNTELNVTVSNPTTSVDVSSLPAITIENTGFNVTNTDPIAVDVNNLAFPETQTVDGTVLIDSTTPVNVTVSNPTETVTITNTGFDATITNADLSVTVSNPQTSVDVTSLPAIAITNTGFDANITNTDLSVTVSNPTTEVSVSNTGFEVTNQPTVIVGNTSDINVNVTNPTTAVDANITNSNLSVTFDNTSIEVSNFPDFPATQTVDGTVLIDSTTPVNVTVSNPTTEVSITNTGFDANITNTNLPVTFSNTSIDVGNFPDFPAVQTVDGSVTVSGTVDANVTFPESQTVDGTVTIDTTTPLDVTFTNTSIEITNTGFEVTNTPNVVVANTTDINVNVTNPTTAVDANITNTDLPVTFSNTSIEVSSLPEITIANTGFDATILNADLPVTFSNTTIDVGTITTLPEIVINDTVPVDVNITNSLTITPPENQNVTVINEEPIPVSGTVTIDVLPEIAITNTEFGITSTQNSVKLTDGTNTASVTATNALKTTLSEGVGTLSTTPMFITIVGAIDGGNWNTP
jgi:hypothetical protein